MLEIQIAGAGAGKTFGLAKKITSRLSDQTIPLKIFALTYTNSAKQKIESELEKALGTIPENVIIETVHSFMLNEIIFPFSGYVLGDRYNKSSVCLLGSKPEYKAANIKKLKERSIVHVEKVYTVSKQIVDRENSKHSSKDKRGKVDRLLILLSKYFDSVFVDEVQDLDSDALRVFEVLGAHILVHLIGDPKQAIKFPSDFSTFIKKHKLTMAERNCELSLSINNVTRRVPKEILKLSNRFCYEGQQQESLNPSTGAVRYIESSNGNFDCFLLDSIANEAIVCIDKKNGRYITNTAKNYQFSFNVEDKIKNSVHGKDDDLVVRSALREFQDNCQKYTKTIAVGLLAKQFKIVFDKVEYAQLYELYDSFQMKLDSTFKVSSIDAVKGLEADLCILILTPNTYRYLIQNISQEEQFNKEWKKIYVALTRAKEELVFAFDHALFEESERQDIRDNLKMLGATEIN